MKLEELVDSTRETGGVQQLSGGVTLRHTRLFPVIEGYASGGHVIIVENEAGFAEYKIMYPDGHLGAIED